MGRRSVGFDDHISQFASDLLRRASKRAGSELDVNEMLG